MRRLEYEHEHLAVLIRNHVAELLGGKREEKSQGSAQPASTDQPFGDMGVKVKTWRPLPIS